MAVPVAILLLDLGHNKTPVSLICVREKYERKNIFIKYPSQKAFTENCAIGEKLIKKMGWKDGTGLGVANQGIQECIKPKIFKDNSGVGFKPNESNMFISHNDEFDDILKSLNTNSPKSKKKKSVKVKNKHRYKKLKKNKDATNYTAEHMTGIIGK